MADNPQIADFVSNKRKYISLQTYTHFCLASFCAAITCILPAWSSRKRFIWYGQEIVKGNLLSSVKCFLTRKTYSKMTVLFSTKFQTFIMERYPKCMQISWWCNSNKKLVMLAWIGWNFQFLDWNISIQLFSILG